MILDVSEGKHLDKTIFRGLTFLRDRPDVAALRVMRAYGDAEPRRVKPILFLTRENGVSEVLVPTLRVAIGFSVIEQAVREGLNSPAARMALAWNALQEAAKKTPKENLQGKRRAA